MYRFCARGTSTGRSTRALSTLNTTAFAPIPIASVRIAVIANPGEFHNFRIAILRSFVILAVLEWEYGWSGGIVPTSGFPGVSQPRDLGLSLGANCSTWNNCCLFALTLVWFGSRGFAENYGRAGYRSLRCVPRRCRA